MFQLIYQYLEKDNFDAVEGLLEQGIDIHQAGFDKDGKWWPSPLALLGFNMGCFSSQNASCESPKITARVNFLLSHGANKEDYYHGFARSGQINNNGYPEFAFSIAEGLAIGEHIELLEKVFKDHQGDPNVHQLRMAARRGFGIAGNMNVKDLPPTAEGLVTGGYTKLLPEYYVRKYRDKGPTFSDEALLALLAKARDKKDRQQVLDEIQDYHVTDLTQAFAKKEKGEDRYTSQFKGGLFQKQLHIRCTRQTFLLNASSEIARLMANTMLSYGQAKKIYFARANQMIHHLMRDPVSLSEDQARQMYFRYFAFAQQEAKSSLVLAKCLKPMPATAINDLIENYWSFDQRMGDYAQRKNTLQMMLFLEEQKDPSKKRLPDKTVALIHAVLKKAEVLMQEEWASLGAITETGKSLSVNTINEEVLSKAARFNKLNKALDCIRTVLDKKSSKKQQETALTHLKETGDELSNVGNHAGWQALGALLVTLGGILCLTLLGIPLGVLAVQQGRSLFAEGQSLKQNLENIGDTDLNVKPPTAPKQNQS